MGDLKLNSCVSSSVAAVRYIFWHLLQPVLYAFVLYAYWDLLDPGQQILGLCVAMREFVYVLECTIGLCVNPVYLLVDLKSSWNENAAYVAVYVISPEKYVFMSILAAPGSLVKHCFYVILFLISIAMDFAGAVAFVWAIIVDNMYAPLMIGYG